jgi:hypothetical protein
MSLTNIVSIPVDTGTAKIRPESGKSQFEGFLFVDRQITPVGAVASLSSLGDELVQGP